MIYKEHTELVLLHEPVVSTGAGASDNAARQGPKTFNNYAGYGTRAAASDGRGDGYRRAFFRHLGKHATVPKSFCNGSASHASENTERMYG